MGLSLWQRFCHQETADNQGISLSTKTLQWGSEVEIALGVSILNIAPKYDQEQAMEPDGAKADFGAVLSQRHVMLKNLHGKILYKEGTPAGMQSWQYASKPYNPCQICSLHCLHSASSLPNLSQAARVSLARPMTSYST